MSVTIRRPLYSGSGFALYNGSALALGYDLTVDSLEQAIYDLLAEVRAVLGGPNSTLASELLTVKNAVKVPPEAQAYYSNIWQVLKPLFDFYEPLVPYTAGWNALFQAFIGNDTPAQVNTITPQVNTIVNTGVPATSLPNPAPAGYGGGTAEQVWTYPLVGYPWIGGTGELNTLDLLQASGHVALNTIASLGVPDPRNPFFAVVSSDHQKYYGDYGYQWYNRGLAPLDPVDWTLWNGTDSIVTFLTAQLPGLTWSYNAPWGQAGTGHAYGTTDADGDQFWLCLVRDVDLPYVSGRGWTATPAGGATPPIWPGEDGVTLGTPVDVTESQIINEAMHGCLIEVTEVEPGAGKWQVGSVNSYYHGGYVAFITDSGAVERVQYLGFGDAIYTPASCSQAAGVLVFLNRVSRLTLTPWTIPA